MSASQTRPMVTIGDIGQFVMELASLLGIGLIGWHLPGKGVFGAVLAVVFILATGWVWGRFRTPGFVPTGREPVHPVDGPVRIGLELAVYAVGIFGIWLSGRNSTALIVLAVGVLTILFSHKRYIALWGTRMEHIGR